MNGARHARTDGARQPATRSAPALVRDVRAGDMEAVQAIYAHYVANTASSFEEIPPGVEDMRVRMQGVAERGLPYLVAETDDGRIAGFAYAAPFRPRSAYRYTIENSIYVSPEATRKGIGTALLKSLIERCRALGYRQMIAVIGDSANKASIGLHASVGFVHQGTLNHIGFKFGRWVDVVIMTYPLSTDS